MLVIVTKSFLRAILCGMRAGVIICLAAASAYATDTSGMFKIQGAYFLGFGFGQYEIGKTVTNNSARISGGGGVGVAASLGYGLTSHVDLEATAGYQESKPFTELQNGSAKFSRTFSLVTLKYKLPVSERARINAGGGAGFYMPGKLDIDTSALTNGAHDVIKYDNAWGAHVLAEVELFFSQKVSGAIGGKYYSVTYKETSGTHNGAPVYFTEKKIKNFDGSGFDILLSVSKYF